MSEYTYKDYDSPEYNYRRPPAIDRGNITCDALGQKASFDSIFTCWIFQFPFLLENIQFGYICYIFVVPIILISLLGKIQEQYRWFILNQAIWDVLISYDFICEKPSHAAYFRGSYSDETIGQGIAQCFYGDGYINGQDLSYKFPKDAARYLSYTPIFLLTGSRFICLYFHGFYNRHSGTLKLIIIIVIVNLLTLATITMKEILWLIFDIPGSNRRMNDEILACTTDNCNRTIWPPVSYKKTPKFAKFALFGFAPSGFHLCL